MDTRTQLARKLSADQAESYRAVTAGEKPPEGSLADLFWASQTALPALPDAFDDPEMGRLAKRTLLPPRAAGQGMAEVSHRRPLRPRSIRSGRPDFAALDLDIPPDGFAEHFRRLLAVTVRYVSQLTGQVATNCSCPDWADASGRG